MIPYQCWRCSHMRTRLLRVPTVPTTLVCDCMNCSAFGSQMGSTLAREILLWRKTWSEYNLFPPFVRYCDVLEVYVMFNCCPRSRESRHSNMCRCLQLRIIRSQRARFLLKIPQTTLQDIAWACIKPHPHLRLHLTTRIYQILEEDRILRLSSDTVTNHYAVK